MKSIRLKNVNKEKNYIENSCGKNISALKCICIYIFTWTRSIERWRYILSDAKETRTGTCGKEDEIWEKYPGRKSRGARVHCRLCSLFIIFSLVFSSLNFYVYPSFSFSIPPLLFHWALGSFLYSLHHQRALHRPFSRVFHNPKKWTVGFRFLSLSLPRFSFSLSLYIYIYVQCYIRLLSTFLMPFRPLYNR